MIRGSLVALVVCAFELPAGGQEVIPLTIDEVVSRALAANAQLPVSASERDLAAARLAEAKAARGPAGSVVGNLRLAPSGLAYDPISDANMERLTVQATQPLYTGGELSAKVESGKALLRAASAGYRRAETDLVLQVHTLAADLLLSDRESQVRHEGVTRLHDYLAFTRQRRAAGDAVEADVLRAEVRLADEEGALEEVAQRRATARIELDVIMGLDPTTPLAIVPPPEPAAPAGAPGEPWAAVPDVAQAAAQLQSLDAEIEVARARRRPHLDLTADAGFWGPGFSNVLAAPTLSERLRNDLGVSVGLDLTWNFWDVGAYQAQLRQAELAARQAAFSVAAARREAQLRFASAHHELEAAFRRIGIRSRQVPVARDAWLLAESMYRGGAATSLEVLDAYGSWVDASVAEATAIHDYRVAGATAARWSAR